MAKALRDLELGFAPVSMAATGAYVLVIHPSVPARNVKELIALGRSRGNEARGNAGMVEVVNTPEMKTILSNQGLEPLTHTPQRFGAFIQGEIAENAKLIKVIGLKAE